MLTVHRAVQQLLSSKAAAVLLRGDPDVRALAMDLAAATILTEGTILWIEAANQFDLYAFTEAAKRWGEPPEGFLKRLRIARAFTIYQLGALATDGLERALRQSPDSVTVVSEPLALAWDAEVPAAEAQRVLRALVVGLQRVRQQGHRLVITAPDPPAAFRHRGRLVDGLAPAATRIVLVRAVEGGVVLQDHNAGTPPRLAMQG
jgi:hypothetical protein